MITLVAVYFNDLDHAVFFTLAYSDYFNFPLKKEEIYQRLPKVWDWNLLIGAKLTSDKLLIDRNPKKITESLEKLEKKQKIAKLKVENNYYYFLKNRQKLVKLRLNKKIAANKRRDAIQRASNFLTRFPTIKALALTGSSALDNAAFNDDLDFCIIVQKNTLWISRFFVILFAKVLRKQPQIDAQAKNQNKQAWCFNLWLDESSLNIIKRGFSIYQAYELIQMKYLFDKASIKNKLLIKNQQFCELINIDINKNYLFDNKNTLTDYFLWPINYFFYFMQKLYRLLFFGKEDFFLNLHQAHFNQRDRQKKIFKSIKKKLQINAFTDF